MFIVTRRIFGGIVKKKFLIFLVSFLVGRAEKRKCLCTPDHISLSQIYTFILFSNLGSPTALAHN